MTTVGHSLAGVSIAVLTLPRGRTLLWYLIVGHLYVFFANLPDFPLPGWGHDAYQVSHSIFVTSLLLPLLALPLLLPKFKAQVSAAVVLAWSGTWLCHMLLDSLYSHGEGIGIFWPLSDAHLALPVPWFETLQWPARSAHNAHVFQIELLNYGLLLAACIGLRWLWVRSQR